MSSRDDQPTSLDPTDVPAPAPALLSAVGAMKPVRTRSPGRGLTLILAAASVAPALALAVKGTRDDLAALPPGWVAAMAGAWVAAMLAVLVSATLPRGRQVMPDAARAGRVTLVAAAALLLLGAFATVDAPGRTVLPAPSLSGFLPYFWECTRFALGVAAPLIAVAALVLRRRIPVGERRVAAALGAAGGALGGLTLHFLCPVGGGLHVAAAHAGAVVIGAAVAAVVLPRFIRA